MVINIVKNSIEAVSDNGNIDISLDVIDDHAVISVSDNGIGMVPERLKRIGEPFIRRRKGAQESDLQSARRLFSASTERCILKVRKIREPRLQFGFRWLLRFNKWYYRVYEKFFY